MKTILIIAFVLAFTELKAQQVNGVDFNSIKSKYIHVEFRSKGLYKCVMRISYGQVINLDKNQILKKDGKNVVFQSPIEGLNWLYKNGFKHKDTYIVRSVQTFLLEKRLHKN